MEPIHLPSNGLTDGYRRIGAPRCGGGARQREDPRGASRKIQIGGASTAPGDPSQTLHCFENHGSPGAAKPLPARPATGCQFDPIGAILARTEANPGRVIKRLEGNPGYRRLEERGIEGLGAPFVPEHLPDEACGYIEMIRQSMPSSV